MSTKKYVLELLENRGGQSISGEHIAKQLGVTRNAVWKAVKELEKDGYKIEAITNKGYRLSDDNDILSVQGLLPFLSNKEISQNISLYPSLKSTNTTAKELAIAGANHGTVIIADYQSGGRGRYNRSFYSPSDNGIYISFILRPSKHNLANNPTLITSFAAVSVCQAIEATTGKAPVIKWVNDIFLDNKKICGILTEAITDFESGNMQWIVLGIGINFTTPDEGFPKEIENTAGSVFSREQPTITRNRLTAELINRILDSKEDWGSEKIHRQYKERLFILGEKITVTESNGAFFDAVAMDIDNIGRLIVKKDNDEILSLAAGEVSLKTQK